MNDPAIQNVLAAQQGALYAQIQATLAAKQLSSARQQGAMIIELLNAAAGNGTAPSLGKAPGLGANFDAVG
jgi:hypothetical protein